jgi:DNA (cytosine-5)-methyltransferase 1
MTATLIEREAAVAAMLEQGPASLDSATWLDREFAALTAELYGTPRWFKDGYELTVTDLFCGAGGSSSGLESVPGIRVVMAANHWQLAIDTHQANFPHVDHDTQDIAKVDPRRFPKTDILWASPSCTFWSQARGEKQDFVDQPTEPTLFDLDLMDDEDDEPLPNEAKERSRALMHDVPRFAEHHRYRAVIVENTPPLLKWWYFPKWIARMRKLGYRHKVLTLNSAFAHQLGAPAPQLRDRVYVVFWLDKYQDPDFDRWTRPRAWCVNCDEVVTALYAPKDPRKPYGAYNRQYVYRCPKVSCRNGIVAPFALPALAALDLSVRGERIGDRKKPLSDKTRARIEAWLARNPQPITLEVAGNTFERRPGVRAWPVIEPLRTLHTTYSRAVATPPDGGAALVPVEGRDGKHAQSVGHPARTQTGRHETALLVPAGGTWNEEARPASEPMRTRTTRESEALVVVPLRNNNVAKHAMEPLDTFAAGGTHHALAMVMRNNTARGNPAQMCTPLDEPLRTITTAGHQSVVTWDPRYLYAYDSGRVRSTYEPLPTQTTVEGDAWLERRPSIDDCLFRMLTVGEIKLGMAFPHRFVLLGKSKRKKVRMCGNAVTPPVPRDLIAAVAESITGNEVAA